MGLRGLQRAGDDRAELAGVPSLLGLGRLRQGLHIEPPCLSAVRI